MRKPPSSTPTCGTETLCTPYFRQWRPETQDSAVGTVVWKLQKSFDRQRSAPTRWQGCLESILTKAGFVSNQLERSLWTHSGQRTALAYHVDDRMMAGARQTTKEVLAKHSKVLETATSKVTSKHSTDVGFTLTTPAVLESITNTLRVCLMNTTFAALKFSIGFRSERRHNDGDERRTLHREHRQLDAELLWIDRKDLRCATEKGFAELWPRKCNICAEHHVNPEVLDREVMTVEPLQFGGSCEGSHAGAPFDVS